MTYTPRTAAEIAASRLGRPVAATGRCNMCDWPIAPDLLYCSDMCSVDHAEELATRAVIMGAAA